MAERRAKRRFPIQLDVLYRVYERRTQLAVGLGRTVDISSSGIVFRTETDLALGARVELTATWPALLDGNGQMRWVVHGNIVRSGGGVTACTIDRAELRTQSGGVPVSEAIPIDFARFAANGQSPVPLLTLV